MLDASVARAILARMSRDRVETMRRIYDAWGRGDFRAGADLYDRHVLLVLNPEFPDAGAYVGPEAIAAYMRDLLPAWSEFAIEGEEFLDAGDTVVVGVRQVGRGPSSGAVTELRYFQVWTFRGDRVIRIESIRERADALEAAGVREQRLRGDPDMDRA
jgi:ketosteroid isomerase-like protein